MCVTIAHAVCPMNGEVYLKPQRVIRMKAKVGAEQRSVAFVPPARRTPEQHSNVVDVLCICTCVCTHTCERVCRLAVPRRGVLL